MCPLKSNKFISHNKICENGSDYGASKHQKVTIPIQKLPKVFNSKFKKSTKLSTIELRILWM
jgi:hypothetical protein